MFKLFNGDCIEVMKTLPDKSIDSVICDPPYGITDCDWDKSIVPLEPMWKELKRLAKPEAPILLFCTFSFGVKLYNSNPNGFKYDLVWEKTMPVGYLNAKKLPLRKHELVLVFGGNKYNPIKAGEKLEKPKKKRDDRKEIKSPYHCKIAKGGYDDGTRYPTSLLEFSNGNIGNVHRTQKPIDLMNWLVQLYSNKGDTVLDFTMGSGSTGVASINLGRNFIGIERDEEIFNIAKARINEASFIEETNFKTNEKQGLLKLYEE